MARPRRGRTADRPYSSGECDAKQSDRADADIHLVGLEQGPGIPNAITDADVRLDEFDADDNEHRRADRKSHRDEQLRQHRRPDDMAKHVPATRSEGAGGFPVAFWN